MPRHVALVGLWVLVASLLLWRTWYLRLEED